MEISWASCPLGLLFERSHIYDLSVLQVHVSYFYTPKISPDRWRYTCIYILYNLIYIYLYIYRYIYIIYVNISNCNFVVASIQSTLNSKGIMQIYVLVVFSSLCIAVSPGLGAYNVTLYLGSTFHGQFVKTIWLPTPFWPALWTVHMEPKPCHSISWQHRISNNEKNISKLSSYEWNVSIVSCDVNMGRIYLPLSVESQYNIVGFKSSVAAYLSQQ